MPKKRRVTKLQVSPWSGTEKKYSLYRATIPAYIIHRLGWAKGDVLRVYAVGQHAVVFLKRESAKVPMGIS